MGQSPSAPASAPAAASKDEQPNEILYFYGAECPWTKKVEPAIECMEDGLKTKVTRLEVWHDLDNRRLFDRLSKDKCPGGACLTQIAHSHADYSANSHANE